MFLILLFKVYVLKNFTYACFERTMTNVTLFIAISYLFAQVSLGTFQCCGSGSWIQCLLTPGSGSGIITCLQTYCSLIILTATLLRHSGDLKKTGYGFATLLNILSERSKLAREKQLREEVEREKAALEARLIQYQEEVSLLSYFPERDILTRSSWGRRWRGRRPPWRRSVFIITVNSKTVKYVYFRLIQQQYDKKKLLYYCKNYKCRYNLKRRSL